MYKEKERIGWMLKDEIRKDGKIKLKKKGIKKEKTKKLNVQKGRKKKLTNKKDSQQEKKRKIRIKTNDKRLASNRLGGTKRSGKCQVSRDGYGG